MKLKYLFLLSFILQFFPCFVLFLIPNSGAKITYGTIFTITTFVLCIYFYWNVLKKTYSMLLKLPVVRSLIVFNIFVTITTVIHFLLGYYNAPTSYYMTRFYKFYFVTLIMYFMPVIAYSVKIKLTTMIRIFYLAIYSLLLISLIQYFVFVFDIHFLVNVFKFFTNANVLYFAHEDGYRLEGRIYAFFSEPSGLGNFLFIMLPFVISLTYSHFKIVSNKYLNFIIKKSFLCLWFIILLLNRSGMYLPLCMIELVVLLIIQKINYIKKYFIQIVLYGIVLLTTIVLLFNSFDFISKLFSRTTTVITYLRDFKTLAVVEPSLATRIVSFAIQIVAFTKNILFGCGLYNVECFINSFYLKEMPLPAITLENMQLHYLLRPDLAGVNKSIVYTLLAETGLIGTLLYFRFLFKNLKLLHILRNKYTGIQQIFLKGLYQSYVCLVIISFYASSIDDTLPWLMYGFILLYYLIYYNKIKNNRSDNND